MYNIDKHTHTHIRTHTHADIHTQMRTPTIKHKVNPACYGICRFAMQIRFAPSRLVIIP